MSEQETKEPTSAEKVVAAMTGDQVEAPAEEVAADAQADEQADNAEIPERAEDKPVEKSDEPEKLVKADGTPYTKADIDGLQTALKAARKDARELKAQLDELKAKGGDRPLDEVVAEAESSATAKWKPLMVRAAARAAFAEAGLALPEGRQEEAFQRAVRLLDEDALTISEDGLVEGLAEQVESIRKDFPDLFTTARRPRIQAADRPAGPKPAPTAADRLAELLAGRKAS
ncbi:MAG TPA: phage scaffolding protein [Glycomyces sp.]|nr:phage scaffolding protein [Glycomyces sp.]